MIRSLYHLARDIKLSHSVFALPFALLAMFMAAADVRRFPSVAECGLIVVCMVLARTAAMAFNRWADAALDRANPRTVGRAIPGGRLSKRFMLGATIVCGLALIAFASAFWFLRGNPWPVIASPLVLAWLLGYSYSKRFTWLCHLILGTALALSPIAAALAIEPEFLRRPDVYLLAAMVMCWVAGFDIIYALQDVEIDRAAALYSMPARLGVEPALWISRVLHLVALAALLAVLLANPYLDVLFTIGIACVALLLILEHALVWGSRTHRIPLAFLTVNGVISLLLGGLGIADICRSLM